MEVEEINLVYKFMKENYDYMYLKSMIELVSVKADNMTLIVGSSHALNGIDTSCFYNAINCSMHTQDLYYDFLCIKNVIEKAKNTTKIERCFVLFGYYMAFQDLSRAENVRDGLLSQVYYPIFKDCHNYNGDMTVQLWEKYGIEDEYKRQCIESEVMNMLAYRNQYYNDFMIRRPLYNFGEKKWRELSDDVRLEYGLKRSNAHNKHLKYIESFNENIEILKDIISLLKNNEIHPIIVIPPFTKEYCAGIDLSLKATTEEMLGTLPKFVDVLDINAIDIGISTDDFIDTDHLNGRGAYKLSKFLSARYYI